MIKLITELLDAAFRELQHDTGPSDPEYNHQYALLKGRFRNILLKESVALRAEVESLRKDKQASRALLTDCRRFIDQFSGKKSERLVRRIEAITSTQHSEGTRNS